MISQVPELPFELLPHPAWSLFKDLSAQKDQIETAANYEPRNEELEYLVAYLAKNQALVDSLGSLETNSDIFDMFKPEFALLASNTQVNYRLARQVLEIGVGLVEVDWESFEDRFFLPNQCRLHSMKHIV
ncbi:MAG: hypothetical protein IPJ48_05170 [Propionivibrio sp.]|uniref:Uncharacterized protein n=1 Tax=Candidatus Propionivibrio dominans TaxID=2954373 RepID=A0A9D7I7X1_9RHOO|nr:hypothetical protein [Candidatus Propionivibrio dominans]